MIDLYEQIREALALATAPGHKVGSMEALEAAVECCDRMQLLLETDHRAAQASRKLYACTALDLKPMDNPPPHCHWVGTWKPEECPVCGTGFLVMEVALRLPPIDRAAIWLALCAGELQIPSFGDDR